VVEPDGTLHVEGFDLPPSAGWSDEARKVFQRRFSGPQVSAQSVEGGSDEERWMASVVAFRSGMEQLHRRLLNRIQEDHPCDVADDVVGGVRVRWVTPRGGVAEQNAERVLVNLHGGAFVGGAEHCGLVESLPVADVGRYRVCVVDYRQGWEHRFPAASEDVAAVLAALGADHAPERIGVFGYSAGGMLTAQAVAWLLDRGSPLPGAIAICSAGAGGSGDSAYLGTLAMGGTPPGAASDDSTIALGGHDQPARFGYSAGVDPLDPLLSPIASASVMAGFPPTLVLTGTRSFDLSGAVRTHRALLAAGVTTELHCWEGMWHCFPYNHRMPESRDAFGTITGYFGRYLA
jgi:epsilon-lactone hydrolase